MFGSAKNFVIQSGATFIDIGKQCNVKKVYYRRSSRGNVNTFHQDDSQILSNPDYKQIKKGDINVIECINGPVRKGSLYDDFIVEVSGENKRKVARIYHGQRGCARLKKELEILSKLWPHPSIPQVFGIYKSKDTIGLVFHGDGTYQRRSEYMQSLQPLQRATFCILYVSHYIDTLEYLCQHIQSLRTQLRLFWGGPIGEQLGWTEDQVELPAQQGYLNFYVDSHGTLKSAVSIYRTTSFSYYRPMMWNCQRPPPTLPKSSFKLIHSILNQNSIISQPNFSMAQLISACHDAFLSVIQTQYKNNDQKIEYYLGHPVILHCPNYNNVHYISGHVKIIQQKFNTNSWFSLSNIFYRGTSRVNQFTCFKLKSDAVTLAAFKNTDHHESISIVGNCHITEDTYHNWLHEASQILENHAVIRDLNHVDGSYMGIVSSVQIHIEITIFFSAILRYMESNKDAEVYLFISNPEIDPVDGRVLEPHIFWSPEKSGAKPLTELSATLIGLPTSANVAMTLDISYWNKFYYEAFHDLYKMCGLTTSDVSRHIGRSELKSIQRKKTFSYVEDIGIKYLKTGHETMKNKEWRPHPSLRKRTSYVIESIVVYSWTERRYCSHVISPNISSLSWIGITTLEDGFAVLGTVYDARERKSRLEEIYEARIFRGADKDEWEEISHVDIDGGSSDTDHFEELSESSIASFDN